MPMTPSITILAAGLGTRLGRPAPKPLTRLRDGRSILQQEWDALRSTFTHSPIYIVVGFKLEMIMEAFPEALFVYNPDYSETNTSKSLLRALRQAPPGGMLWLNGDVVFDPKLLEMLAPLTTSGRHSFVCVNHASVSDEEVKYTVDDEGNVKDLSKQVNDPLGEAVGINFVSAADRVALIRHLEACDDGDYFERGVEMAIAAGEIVVKPIDVSRYSAVEVDTEEDLRAANVTLESPE